MMGSEAMDEDTKLLAEAKAASPVPAPPSSSPRAPLEHDVDGSSPRNDSVATTKSEGGEESIPTPSSPSSESSSARPSFEHNVGRSNPRNESISPSSSRSDDPSPASRSPSRRASLDHDVGRTNPRTDSLTKSKSDGDLSRGQGSLSTPASPNRRPQWSMISASPPIGLEGHLSQTTSPPLQTMTHPSAYDPNRIPSSVFSAKPANASEWSMASNDSLFSIHVGNNSFTKDQLRADQELERIDEGSSSDDSLTVTEAKSNEPCSLPPLMEVPAYEEDGAKSSQVSNLEKEDVNDIPKAGKEENPHCLSTESAHSNTSFAFPVLGNDGGEKSGSSEGVEEKQDSKVAENQTTGGWFACLPCLPRGC